MYYYSCWLTQCTGKNIFVKFILVIFMHYIRRGNWRFWRKSFIPQVLQFHCLDQRKSLLVFQTKPIVRAIVVCPLNVECCIYSVNYMQIHCVTLGRYLNSRWSVVISAIPSTNSVSALFTRSRYFLLPWGDIWNSAQMISVLTSVIPSKNTVSTLLITSRYIV